jgi:hypothetical protein
MPNVLQWAWWSHSWHHLVAFANNCWTRSFALGYWLFYFSSIFDSDEEKTFTGKKLSQVSMYVALFTLALIGDSQFLWQLVVLLCRTTYCWINHGETHEINTCIVFAFKSVLTHEVYTKRSSGSHCEQFWYNMIIFWLCLLFLASSARFDISGWYALKKQNLN